MSRILCLAGVPLVRYTSFNKASWTPCKIDVFGPIRPDLCLAGVPLVRYTSFNKASWTPCKIDAFGPIRPEIKLAFQLSVYTHRIISN